MNRILTSSTLVLASLLMACSNSNNNDPQVDQGPPNPFAGFVSALYSGGDNWLCHPALTDTNNVCAGNIDATLVFADGSTELEPHNRDAFISCNAKGAIFWLTENKCVPFHSATKLL